MENEFKPTDIVRVRSGGPKMTVTEVGKTYMTGQDAVKCTWFENGKKHEDVFHPASLEKC